MALFAAFCWGLSGILVRLISRTETTANQMLVSNALFAAACAVMLFWTWRTPDPRSLAIMIGIGLAGGVGQFVLWEGFRFAPASVVALVLSRNYTPPIWATRFWLLAFLLLAVTALLGDWVVAGRTGWDLHAMWLDISSRIDDSDPALTLKLAHFIVGSTLSLIWFERRRASRSGA